MKNFISLLITLMLLNAILTGCDKSEKQENAGGAMSAVDKGVLLAEVDGEKIYRSQLDALLVNMFGEYQASQLDAQGRDKALQSLVATKALVKMASKELSQQTLEQAELKAQQYRENMIVNAYVKNIMTPQPVNNAMIEAYYKSHLDSFGQKVLVQYELLSTEAVLPDVSRDKFLSVFGRLDKTKGMEHIKLQLERNNFSVQLHKGVLDESVLPEKIQRFIKMQKIKQISNITFFDNKPYIALITAEKTKAAKPLSDVRLSIRKTLAMKQVKETIKRLSESAVKQYNVVYHKAN